MKGMGLTYGGGVLGDHGSIINGPALLLIAKEVKEPGEASSRAVGALGRILNDAPVPQFVSALVRPVNSLVMNVKHFLPPDIDLDERLKSAEGRDQLKTYVGKELFERWEKWVISECVSFLFKEDGEFHPWVKDFFTLPSSEENQGDLLLACANKFGKEMVKFALLQSVMTNFLGGITREPAFTSMTSQVGGISEEQLGLTAFFSRYFSYVPTQLKDEHGTMLKVKKSLSNDATEIEYTRNYYDLVQACDDCEYGDGLRSAGRQVVKAVEVEARDAESPAQYQQLSLQLRASADVMKNPHDTQACQTLSRRIPPRSRGSTGKMWWGALLGLLGVAVVVGSVFVAIASYGGATPLAAVGIKAGMTLLGMSGATLGGAAIGAAVGATGLGVGGALLARSGYKRGLFSAMHGLRAEAARSTVDTSQLSQTDRDLREPLLVAGEPESKGDASSSCRQNSSREEQKSRSVEAQKGIGSSP